MEEGKQHLGWLPFALVRHARPDPKHSDDGELARIETYHFSIVINKQKRRITFED